ncbi:MAG: hypothetical protein ACI9HU_000846, partial [Colwellia sp.]
YITHIILFLTAEFNWFHALNNTRYELAQLFS